MTTAWSGGDHPILESPQVIARCDPSAFHELLERLPAQSREAWALGRSCALPAMFHTPSRVVLLGVGGSAIGADIVATLARLHGRVPVEVLRHYQVPALDEHALVVGCSFSGNTEETLTAFESTLSTPGMRIALTTGGRLATIANERGVPLISYAWGGPPRTALGFGLFTILGLLTRLGAIDVSDAEVEGAIAALGEATERYGLAAPMNEAKALAIAVGKRLPVVIGADFLEVAARRFASEVSENAKQWAFSAALPEFNHNTLQALGSPAGMPHALVPIILDAPAVHPRDRRRVTETERLMTESGARVHVLDAGGDTPLEAIVRATSLASWTSYYMAMLQGIDPLPIEVLETLKSRMSEG
ncbi:MAG: bifunctional phosphoglucose/phosphomannose isomerase [Dehalococcoidia bacterium]